MKSMHAPGELATVAGGRRRGGRVLWLVTAAVAVSAMTLAACGGGSQASSTTTSSGSSSATTGASHGSGSHDLQVKMIEYQFILPTHQVPAGSYTITAVNDGTIIHALTITGPGVNGVATPNVQPGSSATLNVTLQKGSYDLVCPVPGHRQLGMETHVTVT